MQRNVVVFEAENGLDALRDLEFEICVCLAAFDGNADLSVAGINVTACVVKPVNDGRIDDKIGVAVGTFSLTDAQNSVEQLTRQCTEHRMIV